MKRALVIGARGQDGRLLTESLLARGIPVHGIDKGDGVDLGDPAAVFALVERAAADATFYLAAHHHSSEAAREDAPALWEQSLLVNVRGLVHVLEAIATSSEEGVRGGHLFYAASSHVFGSPRESPQDELTPFEPRSAYAISKAAGISVCRAYTERGVRASTGILYNHESSYRSPDFVSSKIVRGARDVRDGKGGKGGEIELASLSAVVDWGFAPDYVDAMIRMVEAPRATDYVVATGEPHTVRDFAEVAFRAVGLDYRDHVVSRESPGSGVSPSGRVPLVGNSTKLRTALGWRPSVTFEEMVTRLVRA